MSAAPQLTLGIVLNRTDFGEADRILTILTPTDGKLRLMAKGVRRIKSKLAGGIELFSVSELSFMSGKGEIGTLVSTRLQVHFGNIVNNIERTMFGYELLKRLNRVIEDAAGPEYFELLKTSLQALNEPDLSLDILEAWFHAQLLKLAGHQPNLRTDPQGQRLRSDESYNFDMERMAFTADTSGRFQARHIKLMRLLFGLAQPEPLQQVEGMAQVMTASGQLINSLFHELLHV